MRTQTSLDVAPSNPAAEIDVSPPRLLAISRRTGVACAISVLVLFVLNAIVFWDHLAGRTSFTFDFPMGYYAGTAYWISAIQHGEWPHWIPYEAMGYPAALNPQLGLFYPPLWLFVLFRMPYTLHAANVFQVAHVLFGAIGFLFLAYRLFGRYSVALLGACGFALFGGFYSNAEHPDIIRGFAWIPWLFCCLQTGQTSRVVALGRFSVQTRLSAWNLFLPVVTAFFITGSYPGVFVAGLVIAGLFVVTEAAIPGAANLRTRIGDGVVQLVSIALGVVLAAAYILPTVALSRELVRAHNYGQVPTLYLFVLDDIAHLVFPSNMFARADYSMSAMQMPVTLLMLAPIAVFAWSRRFVPFVVAMAAAAIMCFSAMRPLVQALIRVAPPLGWSRFPTGDYRVFLYTGLCLGAVAGFVGVTRATRETAWRNVCLMLAVLTTIAVQAMRLLPRLVDPGFQRPLMLFVYTLVGCGVVMIVAQLAWVRVPRSSAVVYVAVLGATVVSGTLAPSKMKQYWSDPQIESFLYTSRGLPLGQGGKVATDSVFARRETSRPARKQPKGFLDLSWRGYIDGSYMINDNVKSLSEQRAAGDPALLSVVTQPSELFALSCGRGVCDGDPSGIALGAPLESGRPLSYARDEIVYSVALPERSLVVENELYAPGWTASCDSHGERLRPERVDGALRGWVLQPGQHTLRLRYETPLQEAGFGISVVAFVIWIVCAAIAYPRLRRAEACG